MKKEHNNFLCFKVKVKAGCKETKIESFTENLLTIRLKVQPVRGKANQELIRYLAQVLDLPQEVFTIVHGHTSPYKLIKLPSHGLKILKELDLTK